MNTFKKIATIVLITFCFSSVIVKAQVIWDFEDGNDHGFTLWSVVPATPAADDPDVAGDEAVTGVGGSDGLPDAGHCWTIGPPNQFDGLIAAVIEGCHVDNNGYLEYSDCNDPFGVFADPANPSYTNPRGQTSYLNTYNLSQWGDDLHSQYNDQIATSPHVLLGDGAMLIVWSYGGGSTGATLAPEAETDRNKDGYWEGSAGIAVLSAADSSFLTSVLTQHRQNYDADTLDLSAFSGQTVIIDVVDAFQGAWGWIAIDEIQITNATLTDVASKPSVTPGTFALMQNYPNPFNPTTQIQYTLGKNTKVEIAVYDLLGHKVATLVDGYQNAGSHKVVWDASEASAGVYLYQMKTNDAVVSKKMILVK